MVDLIILFTASTCLFSCGWATAEKLFWILNRLQKSWNSSLSNWVPFSVITFYGTPYLRMIFLVTKFIIFLEVIVANVFRFSPFSEIINSDNGIFDSELGNWQRPNEIYPPNGEWPWTGYFCKSLASVTLSGVASSVSINIWPKIPIAENFLC